MQSATYVALSSQMALSRQMDVVSNNIANASTPAYKGEHMMFAEYLGKAQGQAQGMSFVRDVGTYRDTQQGPLTRTGNRLLLHRAPFGGELVLVYGLFVGHRL